MSLYSNVYFWTSSSKPYRCCVDAVDGFTAFFTDPLVTWIINYILKLKWYRVCIAYSWSVVWPDRHVPPSRTHKRRISFLHSYVIYDYDFLLIFERVCPSTYKNRWMKKVRIEKHKKKRKEKGELKDAHVCGTKGNNAASK